MSFILSIWQVVERDRLLHFGAIGNKSPTYAPKEEAAEEKPQGLLEWSIDDVL